MTNQPQSIASYATSLYWCTIVDCQKIFGCSRATIFRYLQRVPAKDKVLVTRKIDGVRTTRYWRISPNGVRILGHLTRQAPYL